MEADPITQFAGITGSSEHIAAQYLRLAEGNTEQAIELFFANDGADLEASSEPSQLLDAPPPIPPASTRPTGHRQEYEDEHGIVHIDSDQEDHNYGGEDDDVEITGQSRRPTAGRPSSSFRDSGNGTHPASRTGTGFGDDEAMARRLQEELYGAAGSRNGSGNASSEVLDEYGYRAPMGRTTETLVGPGSFDPSNEEEMRAAVAEQMMARRQHPRHRGELTFFGINSARIVTLINHRAARHFQPGHCIINMERCRQSP